jgi:hypothetical protein
MTQTELQNVANSLNDAADATGEDEACERLQEQAATFESLANTDQTPDHGQLARHEHVLSEIAEDEADAAEHIETALESIRAYRETIEGV